jgi:hypothetical protein
MVMSDECVCREFMDGRMSVGGVELMYAGHKTGLMCTTLPTLFLYLFFEYQLIVGLINPNYNSTSRLVLNPSFPSNGIWVSNSIVLLNQKKRKYHTLPGIWTSQLAVSSDNHCTNAVHHMGRLFILGSTYFVSCFRK